MIYHLFHGLGCYILRIRNNAIDVSSRLFKRLKEITFLVGGSKNTIFRLVAAGGILKQVYISERSVSWRRTEIEEYIKNTAKGSLCPILIGLVRCQGIFTITTNTVQFWFQLLRWLLWTWYLQWFLIYCKENS